MARKVLWDAKLEERLKVSLKRTAKIIERGL